MLAEKLPESSTEELPNIGDFIQGGYFTGVVQRDGHLYGIVTSPKSFELTGVWGERGKKIEGANSVNDCLANTKAMAEAGSEIAKKVLAFEINGFNDWAIASRDAKELQYRHLKPTEQENYCSFRDGDNPSSVPPGHLYTEESPAQTTVEAFKEGGAEAFEDGWYWTSTQYSAYHAYSQDFDVGFQSILDEGNELRVRPVRSFLIR